MTVADAWERHLREQPEIQRVFADQVWPLQLPDQQGSSGREDLRAEDRWPALTWRLVSVERAVTQTGPVGLVVARIQVDIWARDPGRPGRRKSAAVTVRRAGDVLRRVLDGHRGILGHLRADRVSLDTESDDFDPASPRRLWRRRQDYLIWVHEPVEC